MVVSGRHKGKQSLYLDLISASFLASISWKEIVSMRSHTAAITGAGRRYPANAGSDAVSSVLMGGRRALGGVGGGTTLSGAQLLVGISGLSRS